MRVRELDAKQVQRQLRETRYYTGALLGRPCPACHNGVPKALNDAGFTHHPCCDPASREEMAHAHPA